MGYILIARFGVTIPKVRNSELGTYVKKCVFASTPNTPILNFFAKLEIGLVTALGDKIRDLRKQRNYTLEKLAELTESSKSYIWELENKNPPRPSAEKIGRIAAVLGVTAEYLLDRQSELHVADAADEAFFRKYRRMEPDVKNRIRRMIEVWDDDK